MNRQVKVNPPDGHPDCVNCVAGIPIPIKENSIFFRAFFFPGRIIFSSFKVFIILNGQDK